MNDPNRYSGLSDEQLKGVHAACETFEQALRNDEPIAIEDCLAAVSEPVRDFLFRELLAIELEWQRARERSPEIVEYRARFPDRHDDLERGFLELLKSGPATGFLKEFGRYPIDGVPDNGPRVPGQNRAPSSISVPGYEVEGVLGRGGMGVVYKARNLKLKRTVALKMVLADGHAGPRELARFRIEAEAAARLQHPNIVQIHEVGTADGHPYCALEFVDGGNLAARLADKPMPARDSAKLVETLARAMHLAHSHNVVHRDLKPANVLLTVDGTPKITDFGLARQMDMDSGETQAGAVMGTPAYMAPEQASGHAHHAGPAADVYALGAILYDCLAGRPPFKGSSVVETLDQVRTQEPAPPSRWRTSVPLDLDTISLKCLRKEPEKRYASAAELADDLVRYLNGEPILARKVGRIERAGKWVQRNPMVATSLAGLTGLILSAFLLVSWSYLRAEDALKEEAMQRHAADVAREAAQREQKAERWARYRSDIAAASAAMQVQNNGVASSALEDAPKQHRNWEWRYLHGQLDGAQLVLPLSGGGDQSFILSPSGRQIAVRARHDQINLYGVANGRLEAVLRGHSAQVMSTAYRPDGKQIATYGEDQTIRLWDPSTGQQISLLRAEFTPPNLERSASITYSSDGRRIASYSRWKGAAGTSRLWDATTGREIAVLAKWQKGARPVAFSSDGKRVAVGSGEYVYLCDAITGHRLAVLAPHTNRVEFLAYSPNGRRIASMSGNTIHLWDSESGTGIGVLRDHSAEITSLVFSPDGSRLVSGSKYPENAARLWEVATGRLLAVLAGHKNEISTVAFSSDGKRVATASTDQSARLWDGYTGQLVAVLAGHAGQVMHVLFSPNGTRIATAADDAALRLWDARTGDLIGVLRGHGNVFPWDRPPVFTPDGSRLVSCSPGDGTVRVWDIGQIERNILRGHESFVYDVAFSPNGEQVASAAWDATARLWDASTGRQTGLLKHETTIIGSVAYSRDGLHLATRERDIEASRSGMWGPRRRPAIGGYPLAEVLTPAPP